MLKAILLLYFMYVSSVLCATVKKPTNLPCQLNDAKCINYAIQWIYSSAIPRDPAKGIESSDPMYQDKIDAKLGYVNFTLTKVNSEGYKTCKISNTSFNSDMSVMHIDSLCLRVHLDGDYVIDGKLLTYPIKGNGDFYADYTNYHIIIDSNVSFFRQGRNLHLKLESFTLKAELLGEIDFEMRNLFDGNKELSDTIHNFGKNNPQLFVSLVHDPFFKSSFKKVFKSMNKLFMDTPITELMQVN